MTIAYPDFNTVTHVTVLIRPIKYREINGKDVDLDKFDDPNSNLTDEEKRQIRLACQNQGMMAIAQS